MVKKNYLLLDTTSTTTTITTTTERSDTHLTKFATGSSPSLTKCAAFAKGTHGIRNGPLRLFLWWVLNSPKNNLYKHYEARVEQGSNCNRCQLSEHPTKALRTCYIVQCTIQKHYHLMSMSVLSIESPTTTTKKVVILIINM